MSVVLSFILPNQPSGGTCSYQPLGGNGKVAPFAMYEFSVSDVGDATGGYHQFYVTMDPQYSSTVLQASLSIDQAIPSNMVTRWVIGHENRAERLFNARSLSSTGIDVALGAYNVAYTWRPPPHLIPGGFPTPQPISNSYSLQVVFDNVNGDTARFTGQVLLFDVNIRQRVPLPVIFAAAGPQTGNSVG